jgi:anthranilate phosphoribosyltransferase
VFSPDWVEPLARVLKQLGSEHVLVVHAEDGLDEISIAAPTRVAELREGDISEYIVTPEDFGLQRAELSAIAVENAQQSLAMINTVFEGQPGPARDIVCLNAGAAIYAAGLAASLADGVVLASEVIQSGKAGQTFAALVDVSNTV